ncbi:hypothetical protein [Limosilactobacillus agrestis]|uniref:hypothetical protein n=2 Tax=Limosilactobacillus TaxID=2742598 RepID=UPI001C719851|nr:hypothetical protein [Limosilactobacillus agrestis]
MITLFCAAISSVVAVCFKNYYLMFGLIISFLIVAIIILAIFYSELRIAYNAMSERLDQMIDVPKLNKEAMEEKLKQGTHDDDFNTASTKANTKKEGLSSQDPEERD